MSTKRTVPSWAGWIGWVGVSLVAGQIGNVLSNVLVPYLLWVSYAAALNFALWRMNPGL
ncbi:hypothetical protein BH23GEM10_BH23GEM10_15100 [soil metagenome]